MKIKSLPVVNYTFDKVGTIQCTVASGSVTVTFNGTSQIIGGQKEGNGNTFAKKRKKTDPVFTVSITANGDKARMVFTVP